MSLVGFLAWPGPDAQTSDEVSRIGSMDDPAVAGKYAVTTTAYGSGTYAADPAYGADVPIKTEPVDASSIIEGWSKDSPRSDVWGFSASDLPLNARVWAPDGPGQFPLVLIVHGNTAFEKSETGFEYLGSRLASRGYVVASIDEGILNTGLLDKANPITGAETARAWLVLQHLAEWQLLNERPGNAFTGKIDLSQVSLIGHSRGGEAVAVAASQREELLALDGTPPTVEARIRTVVALAPSDGQLDSDRPIELSGTNYLTLGGTYDADVSTFAGARQFDRVKVGPDLTKAAVSINRANHTQFNTNCGRYDAGFGAAKYLLGTAALLSTEEQQQATTAYVCAFLDLTIKGQEDARPLFDGTTTGMDWLPPTTFVQQYAEGSAESMQDFAAGTDLAKTEIGKVTVTGSEEGPVALPTRMGPSGNRVLSLTWSSDDETATYEITEIGSGSLPDGAVLTADIANAGANKVPVRVTIEDAAGRSSTVPFGEHPDLAAMVTGTMTKPPLPGGSIQEPQLRTFRLGLDSAGQDGFDTSSVSSLTITFAADTGSVYLDNVGVTTPLANR